MYITPQLQDKWQQYTQNQTYGQGNAPPSFPGQFPATRTFGGFMQNGLLQPAGALTGQARALAQQSRPSMFLDPGPAFTQPQQRPVKDQPMPTGGVFSYPMIQDLLRQLQQQGGIFNAGGLR